MMYAVECFAHVHKGSSSIMAYVTISKKIFHKVEDCFTRARVNAVTVLTIMQYLPAL